MLPSYRDVWATGGSAFCPSCLGDCGGSGGSDCDMRRLLLWLSQTAGFAVGLLVVPERYAPRKWGIMDPMHGGDLERLFAEHANSLFAFFVYRTQDRALAEDLVADTFERVLRSRRRFDPRKGSEKNWIYAIGLNLLRDQARRHGLEQRTLERVGAERRGADGGLDGLELRDELSRGLATLSEKEREAVALRFGADLTLREVARVLREPAPAIEKRIYRALAKLREELE